MQASFGEGGRRLLRLVLGLDELGEGSWSMARLVRALFRRS